MHESRLTSKSCQIQRANAGLNLTVEVRGHPRILFWGAQLWYFQKNRKPQPAEYKIRYGTYEWANVVRANHEIAVNLYSLR